MANRENTEWKVIRDEEDEEELVNADWIVVDQSGELVANVHGRTVGDCITNADIIASAPRLQRHNRDMDFAIRRLIKVFTPSPTAGIVDEAERKNAIFQQSVERSEAIEAARSLISWHKCQYCKGTGWLVLPAMKGAVPCDHGRDAKSWICADAATPKNGETSIELPCPRCGRCRFIEDADMNLAGECPECSVAGTLKSKRTAGESADETSGRSAYNAGGMARELAAQNSESPTKQNG